MDWSICQNPCQTSSPGTSWKKNSTVVSHHSSSYGTYDFAMLLLVYGTMFYFGLVIMFIQETGQPNVNRNLSGRPGVWSMPDGLQGLQECRVSKPPEGRNIDMSQVMLWQSLGGDVKEILWYRVIQGLAWFNMKIWKWSIRWFVWGGRAQPMVEKWHPQPCQKKSKHLLDGSTAKQLKTVRCIHHVWGW